MAETVQPDKSWGQDVHHNIPETHILMTCCIDFCVSHSNDLRLGDRLETFLTERPTVDTARFITLTLMEPIQLQSKCSILGDEINEVTA